MSRIFLTDRTVSAMPAPAKETEFHDEDTPYLVLRAYPNGRKPFYYRRALEGKQIKLKLGEFPQMTTGQARDLVAGLVQASREGMSAQRYMARHIQQRLTFGALYAEYLAQHLQVHASKKVADEAAKSLTRYFSRFVDVPVQDITTNDVTVFMNDMATASGKATANRQFVIVKACMNWGMNQGLIDLKRNPCRGARLFIYEGMERERYLRPPEVQALLLALDTVRNQEHADIIRLLLFTGQRKSNVMQMEWSELDLEAGVWTVPAHKAKARKSIVVALTGNALDILKRRPQGYRFVFPAKSSMGCILNISDTWYAARKRAGLGDDVVLHTLRHTAGSMLGQSGASAFVIQRALGHASTRMSEKYTKLDVDCVRDALEVSQVKMTGGVSPDRGPNVLTFKRQPAPPAVVVQDEPAKPPAKNADRVMTTREQRIIEGKILASISRGLAAVSDFHRKIGGSLPCNAKELARILESMFAEGLVRKDWDSTRKVIKYVLCEENEKATALPIVSAKTQDANNSLVATYSQAVGHRSN